MSTSHKDLTIRAEKLATTSFKDIVGILEALRPLPRNPFSRIVDMDSIKINEQTTGFNECVYEMNSDIDYLIKEYKKQQEEKK